ncbi:TPA: hypothetical protein ACTW90_001690 [Raoultella ornithinolytica]
MSSNYCIPQGMTCIEREEFKRFATRCGAAGDTQSLERALIMVAHWMRQRRRVSFTEYASQWTEAQKGRDDGNHSTAAMADVWPFSGKRCISPGGSDYYPAGVSNEPGDDETEIRHAVTVITAEYPQFNCDGMALYSRETVWQNPFDNPSFLTAAKSCLSWIRANGLGNGQIKGFPKDNATSYDLKHDVEQHNQRNHPHEEHPHYISNGAFIAAMVASGYKVKLAGRMNVFFNISKKELRAALGKN